jgi:hypothetical protein
MPGGLLENLVRYWIGPITEPGDGLGERQRSAFGVAKVGRIPPGRHCEEALVRFARLLGIAVPESTQTLQPLIWLARRWTRPSVVDGTPRFCVAAAAPVWPAWHQEGSSLGFSSVLA